jgi:hypothetical protein
VASPPIAIVPLPLIVAEGRIPLAAERIATPVISNSRVATTIIGGILRPVDREVSIPIHRYVIATAKLIRVSKTINVRVPCLVHRDIPFTICRSVSVAINRQISVASCS